MLELSHELHLCVGALALCCSSLKLCQSSCKFGARALAHNLPELLHSNYTSRIHDARALAQTSDEDAAGDVNVRALTLVRAIRSTYL